MENNENIVNSHLNGDEKKKPNKKVIIGVIIGFLVILGIIGYFQSSNGNKSNTNTSSGNTNITNNDKNSSGSSINGTNNSKGTINKDAKGTSQLLNNFDSFVNAVNPDLKIISKETITGLGNDYIAIKFTCNITDEGVKEAFSKMKDSMGVSVDITKITTEQLNLFKLQMDTDCKNNNSVLLTKGLLFMNNKDAVVYSEITPSKLFVELQSLLPVEFQQKDNNDQILLFFQQMFSYEKNINKLVDSPEKKAKVKEILTGFVKRVSVGVPNNQEVNQKLNEAVKVVLYYVN